MSRESRRVCVLWTAACSFCEKVLCSHMLQPENENPGIGRNAGTHEQAVGAEEEVEKKAMVTLGMPMTDSSVQQEWGPLLMRPLGRPAWPSAGSLPPH